MTLERRTFLALLGGGLVTATGGATALFVTARAGGGGDDRSDASPAVGAARAVLGDDAGVRRVGELYLVEHPDHPAAADPDWFPAGVMPPEVRDPRGWLRATPAPQIVAAIRDAVRTEFARGASHRVGGWWITPTTGGLCALISRHG